MYVCSCKAVTEDDIKEVCAELTEFMQQIDSKATSDLAYSIVCDVTKAGSGCSSCARWVREIVDRSVT